MFGFSKKKKDLREEVSQDIEGAILNMARTFISFRNENDFVKMTRLTSSLGSHVVALREKYPKFPFDESGLISHILDLLPTQPSKGLKLLYSMQDYLVSVSHDRDAVINAFFTG